MSEPVRQERGNEKNNTTYFCFISITGKKRKSPDKKQLRDKGFILAHSYMLCSLLWRRHSDMSWRQQVTSQPQASAKRDECTHAFLLVLLSSVFLHIHTVLEPPT